MEVPIAVPMGMSYKSYKCRTRRAFHGHGIYNDDFASLRCLLDGVLRVAKWLEVEIIA